MTDFLLLIEPSASRCSQSQPTQKCTEQESTKMIEYLVLKNVVHAYKSFVAICVFPSHFALLTSRIIAVRMTGFVVRLKI